VQTTPRSKVTPAVTAARSSAWVRVWSAVAGYPRGTIWAEAPSSRTAPVATTTEPRWTEGWRPPQVPARMMRAAPPRASSSKQIAAPALPTPWEQIETATSP
jgi:hypothetical protein